MEKKRKLKRLLKIITKDDKKLMRKEVRLKKEEERSRKIWERKGEINVGFRKKRIDDLFSSYLKRIDGSQNDSLADREKNETMLRLLGMKDLLEYVGAAGVVLKEVNDFWEKIRKE